MRFWPTCQFVTFLCIFVHFFGLWVWGFDQLAKQFLVCYSACLIFGMNLLLLDQLQFFFAKLLKLCLILDLTFGWDFEFGLRLVNKQQSWINSLQTTVKWWIEFRFVLIHFPQVSVDIHKLILPWNVWCKHFLGFWAFIKWW